eukprot:CAMPEP_0114561906 /NCGR_PEP_ID=MMETSP0114-20121206/12247_1 /TAXON_ID=31324 /ORGANISM="Goniomonas sp, Strain m" /LENGTH=107 /DNA_ID=CAMNT_0001747559 /DNA_START=130 /DNA_END=453 /DNA_ORIENTATION=+
MVVEMDTETQFNEELRSGKLLLVFFSAAWCGPCRRLAPFVDELEEGHPEVRFLRVDVDDQEAIAARQKITAMPTFVMYQHGMQLGHFTGASEQKLKELLEKFSNRAR